MNKKEFERLIIVEQKIENLTKEVSEIKNYLKQVKDRIIGFFISSLLLLLSSLIGLAIRFITGG